MKMIRSERNGRDQVAGFWESKRKGQQTAREIKKIPESAS